MPHVSKNKLDQKTLYQISERLFSAIRHLKHEREVSQFFNDLLTKTERIMLAKRLAIVVMLEANYPFKVISRALKVSEATVSNMRDRFDRGGDGYRLVLERFKKEKFWKDFFKSIEKILQPDFLPPITGKGRWRNLNS